MVSFPGHVTFSQMFGQFKGVMFAVMSCANISTLPCIRQNTA